MSFLRSYTFFFNFQRNFTIKNLTKIFTPFCRSRRDDSKYIYFVGSHKVFFYYNYIIGGKNPKIDRNKYMINNLKNYGQIIGQHL